MPVSRQARSKRGLIPSEYARRRFAACMRMLALLGSLQLCFSGKAYALPELPAVSAIMEQAHEANMSTYYDEKNSSAVLYLGGEHTFNPTSPQITIIEKMFAAFRPTLVIVEGGNWPLAQSDNEAVRKYSEMGFARYLAAQQHAQVQSFDPDTATQVSFALQSHSPREVKLYLAMRMVPQWRATETEEALGRKMNAFLSPKNSQANFGPDMPADTFPRNVDELEALMRSDFGADVDWRSADAHAGIGGRKFKQMLATDQTINSLRNMALRASIIDAMRSGNRVFVLTGVTHLAAVVQPLMRQMEEFK